MILSNATGQPISSRGNTFNNPNPSRNTIPYIPPTNSTIMNHPISVSLSGRGHSQGYLPNQIQNAVLVPGAQNQGFPISRPAINQQGQIIETAMRYKQQRQNDTENVGFRYSDSQNQQPIKQKKLQSANIPKIEEKKPSLFSRPCFWIVLTTLLLSLIVLGILFWLGIFKGGQNKNSPATVPDKIPQKQDKIAPKQDKKVDVANEILKFLKNDETKELANKKGDEKIELANKILQTQKNKHNNKNISLLHKLRQSKLKFQTNKPTYEDVKHHIYKNNQKNYQNTNMKSQQIFHLHNIKSIINKQRVDLPHPNNLI